MTARANRLVRLGLALLATGSLVLSASRAHAGPIILAGHDPDDHGFTTQYAPLFTQIYANVTNGNSGILAIGADTGSAAGNWITTVASLMVPPQTVTFVNGAAISSVSFSSYAILHIPSTNVDTPGGIHATNENPLLSARSNDIATFINNGGGLFGLTQDQVADAYDYLGPFADVQATGVPASGDCDGGGGSQLYDNVTATPLGTSLGITNTNIDGCCWHNVFSSFAPFLQTLATANEPACTLPAINGIASVIGCLDCSLPGQMNLDPVLDLNPPNAQHTVTATLLESFAPNDPIAGVVVTFLVLSGPNAGETGMDTTDISGQATFTYTGDGGIGVDVIQATAEDNSETIESNLVQKFWDNDCNNNSIPDTCDISCSALAGACNDWVGCGGSADVNGNSVPDTCDECVNNAQCNDAVFCNGAETCVSGSCVNGAPVNCDDGVSCTADACNEITDQCDNVVNNGVCNNGQFCDGVETCHPTNDCQPGTPPNCNDGVACTADLCNEATDQCDNTPNDGSCSNGVFCDGAEFCHPTLGCQASPPVACGDGVSCTIDSCNEATDQCDNLVNHAACSNGAFCDGNEICDPLDGCEPGAAPNCNDGVACTGDACNEGTDQCDHTPNHGSCSNGLFCDGNEVCDPLDGCEPGTAPNCADAVSCTADSCNEAADQCDHIPNNVVCDDGQFCTGTETCDSVNDCQPGTDPCVPMSCSEVLDQCVTCLVDAQCDNGLFCDGAETCDEGTGMCVPGTPVVCNDGVACTVDECDEGTDSCDVTPNDTSCSNAMFCDGVETCDPVNGCEAGSAPNCNDGVACTVDACNEGTDQCDHAPDAGSCNNGLFCDGPEVCHPVNGCQPGTSIQCGDGIGCTTDTCNEATDACDHAAVNSVCGDGQFCNGDEVCSLIDDCVPGSPVNCVDGTTCTFDTCVEALNACVNAPQNGACANGLFCDGAEICHPIDGCVAGPPVDCDDSDACTIEMCDELANTCDYEDICCGNGVLDPGEFCEPGPGEEICNNLLDDDGDTLYDCADPECTVETCGVDCAYIPQCGCIQDDPAIIRVGNPGFFKIHGRIPGTPGTIDPQGDGFAIQLTNQFGVLYQAELPPGSFIPRSHGRYRYKDKTASTGVDPVGPHAGLYQLSLRFVVDEGDPYLSFKVKAFGDLSLATVPCMTTQVTSGSTTAGLRTDWTEKPRGWILRVSDYTCPGHCAP